MRPICAILLAFTALLLILRPAHAENHYALIIASGEFPIKAYNPLAGPRHDARMVASLLQWRFGFKASDISVIGLDDKERNAIDPHLVDGGRFAKYETIKRGFLWLKQQAVSVNDDVVVYYAGHGTLVYNPDKQSSHVNMAAWVPYDIDRFGKNLVLFAEIKAWMDSISSHHKTEIIDCCYSGNIVRSRGDNDEEAGPGEVVSRNLPIEGISVRDNQTGQKETLQDNIPAYTTVLTASGGNEKALQKELFGNSRRPNIAVGEFTWALYQTLCRDQRPLTPMQLRNQVEARLRQRPTTQTPALFGVVNGLFIGPPPGTACPYVPIEKNTPQCLLNVGWLAGVREGTWLVPSAQPSGALRIGDEAIGWFQTTLSPLSLTSPPFKIVPVQTFP